MTRKPVTVNGEQIGHCPGCGAHVHFTTRKGPEHGWLQRCAGCGRNLCRVCLPDGREFCLACQP